MIPNLDLRNCLVAIDFLYTHTKTRRLIYLVFKMILHYRVALTVFEFMLIKLYYLFQKNEDISVFLATQRLHKIQ